MDKKTWDEKVKDIRPASIVLVWGDSWLSKIIKWYQKLETGESDTPSHAEIYWGSGEHMTVSAEWNGVRKMNFNRYFGKKVKLEVYHYIDLKVSDMQMMKNYSLGTVGRVYDYKGLISFLSNLKIIYKILRKKITPTDYADFCSENVADTFSTVGIKVSKKKFTWETHPADIWIYIRDSKRWKKSFDYNNL